MNFLAKLFNKTLHPTDREHLEIQRDDFKRSSDKWFHKWLDTRADLKRCEAENRRLEGHIDNNRALFAEIHAQGKDSASGTARSMAAKAAAGCAK